jgi:hypothetical protein
MTDILIIVLVGVLAVCMLIAFCIEMAENSCAQRAALLGFQYKWTGLTGCYVQYQNGKWIDIDSYMYVK